MQKQTVFDRNKERERLKIQNRLLSPYEMPVLTQAMNEKKQLCVLDIGCNDGTKTKALFSRDNVKKVIGLEYNEKLAETAQKNFGDDKFSFYGADVEKESFSQSLQELMDKNNIEKFDVIYLSFLLMHLKEPKALLKILHRFLASDGRLIIVEANDGISSLSGDEDELLEHFLDILDKDPYSGNRRLGAILEDMLEQCDYENITLWCSNIIGRNHEKEKKNDIFQTFFSYLSEDVALLRDEYSEDTQYRRWNDWLDTDYKKLRHLILEEDSEISMGVKILSCTRGGR